MSHVGESRHTDVFLLVTDRTWDGSAGSKQPCLGSLYRYVGIAEAAPWEGERWSR